MAVVVSLKQRQRDKQVNYERSMLQELTLDMLKAYTNEVFSDYIDNGYLLKHNIENGCVDMAIEAYLLGASFSKFGYYGETVENAKRRCLYEQKYVVDSLYDYLLFWGRFPSNGMFEESVYYTCEVFVDYWWNEGFSKGERRYRLRLHK
ncbi:DUF2521 family protein [Bacillus sp. HMF5848]|uniref:DUF2521 family protein n=1 Tax=Bacillus sp. HMF5848 TaxID=2495421 RepID=UPI000F7A05FA|nr:DUF2521 family protein [Bacillus sp. HMF5848]RSK25584.1 DUF2521 family protein [Bacillus sp. HMF5848]